MEVPKPKAYKGTKNGKQIDNFLWNLEQYFRVGLLASPRMPRRSTMRSFISRIPPKFGVGVGMPISKRALAPSIHGKSELKKQFYPDNAEKEARAKLRRLTQNIRDYVKEFSEVLLEIPDDKEALAKLSKIQASSSDRRSRRPRRKQRCLALLLGR